MRPVYERAPSDFGELIAPFPPHIRATASWIRDVLLEEFPQVRESMGGGTKVAHALYSVGGADRVALGIQPGPRFVKLFIHDPEAIGDTPLRLEGRGKHMRHVKFSEPPTEEREHLIALMRIPVERRA